MVIQSQPDLLLVGQAENAEDALSQFRRIRPDVTILLGVALVLGAFTRVAAFLSGWLLLLFALSMTFALGLKAPHAEQHEWLGATRGPGALQNPNDRAC